MTDFALEVKGLTKVYKEKKGKEIRAVDNISFQVPRGELFGLLGPNGAGKTTTVKMICGLILPDRGRILVEGIDNQNERKRALTRVSAVLEGNRNIYWRLTPRENLEFFAAIKGRNPAYLQGEIQELLDFFDLNEKKDVPARKLSRGMQQKLAIAVCLISGSPLIILDEPTLGLDVKASYDIRHLLKEIVKKDGKTIILTTHDMNVVEEVCDEVLIIDEGKIITQDRTENLLQLFRACSYRLVIKSNLTEEQKSELEELPFVELESDNDKLSLYLDSRFPENFYRVMDILKKENTIIERIEERQLNFEKIFMEILKGRKAG